MDKKNLNLILVRVRIHTDMENLKKSKILHQFPAFGKVIDFKLNNKWDCSESNMMLQVVLKIFVVLFIYSSF